MSYIRLLLYIVFFFFFFFFFWTLCLYIYIYIYIYRFWHQQSVDLFTDWQENHGYNLSFHLPGSIRLMKTQDYKDEHMHQWGELHTFATIYIYIYIYYILRILCYMPFHKILFLYIYQWVRIKLIYLYTHSAVGKYFIFYLIFFFLINTFFLLSVFP